VVAHERKFQRLLTLVTAALLGAVACGDTERDPPLVPGVATSGSGGTSLGGAGAGMGGGAGEPAEPPGVSQCQGYCDALPYELPRALCEDWNYLDTPAEFCLDEQAPSCDEQCEVLYETVSPACAAALPAAIDCVAPTYEDISAHPPMPCWLEECRAELYDLSSACYGLREGLEAARATWEASGVSSYELRYVEGLRGEVVVTVDTSGEASVTPSNATAWTVPVLFDEVERILDTPGMAPQVEYDDELGYVAVLQQDQGCEPRLLVGGVAVTPLD